MYVNLFPNLLENPQINTYGAFMGMSMCRVAAHLRLLTCMGPDEVRQGDSLLVSAPMLQTSALFMIYFSYIYVFCW